MNITVLSFFFTLFVLVSVPLWAKIDPELEHQNRYDKLEITPSKVNVTHQKLHLNVDPGKRYIQGQVITTFSAVTDSISVFRIDLHENLIIDSILSNEGEPLLFKRNGDHTTDITLDRVLTQGSHTTINMYYQGEPPTDGFGSFVQTAHATDSIIWTLSEPYGARNWWPCTQNLSDKIDSLDMWVSVPTGYRAAGNGLLISENHHKNGTTTFHWKHRYPIVTYLVAFAVTNYNVHTFEIELENGPLPIVNYLYPQDYGRYSSRIESILPGMMRLFEELFIPYPFDREKYGHAQFGFSGGMEHQTMSFMGGFSYSLTAHELAHQWFGNYATCGSWQDIWLNEGFANYLTGLTYERILQNGTWENYLESSIRDITSLPGGSVFVEDTTDFRRIFNSRLSYKKGGMVLHMLRWIVGDQKFFEGIRQYLRDENTQYAFVRTRHLVNHMEIVSGLEMDKFFSDWYEGEGFPSFHLQWEKTDSGITVLVHQTTSSTVPFFELPLEIGLYGEGQKKLVRLNIQKNDQFYSIDLDWEVDSIAVDPRHWLISAGNTTEVVTDTQHPSSKSEPYSIYPNPAENSITIENHSIHTSKKMYLYTLTGQLIDTWNEVIQRQQTSILNLSNHTPGFYLLIIENEHGTLSSHKMMIH